MLCFASCEKMFYTQPESSPTATFEYLWNEVDRKYALFDVKDLDWQALHDHYAPMVTDDISDDSLFAVLSALLNHLDDGHVNLIAPFDVSRCQGVYDRMYRLMQVNDRVVALNYLRADYHRTGGFSHNAIANGQVVYILYSSFSSAASSSQLNYILNRYPEAQGVVLDLRQNGGGSVENIWNILRLFAPQGEAPLLYRTQLKNGPDHNDFTPMEEVYAPENTTSYDTYTKPVVVLTDRGCYSATSFFALSCRAYPNITTVGDTTGGGLGIPNGGQLPNGWYYRFSITRTLDPQGNNYENGVPPEVQLLLDPQSTANGRDNLIDYAVELILSGK